MTVSAKCYDVIVGHTHLVTHCAGIIGFTLVDALDVAAPLVVLSGAVLGIVGWASNVH